MRKCTFTECLPFEFISNLFYTGSVAVAGHAMKWLRDNMGFIKDIQHDTESLAQEVFNTGDVYFVPAFKGLYAPYWRKDARGCVSFF